MVTRCGVWHRYDKVGISFLFGLTAEHDIDSIRLGNKSRFFNSSANPNLEQKVRVVVCGCVCGVWSCHTKRGNRSTVSTAITALRSTLGAIFRRGKS